jgi:predicted ATPase
MNTQLPRIVITGAPASGKTDFMLWLRTREGFSDFVFFDELARILLTERPEYRHHWHEFHREIYNRQRQREDDVDGRPFVTDRGTVDAFAFHPETMQDVGTTLEHEYSRYSQVIQLGTAAALGEEIYKTDDIRRESCTEALHIERALIRVWDRHPRYHFIPPHRLLTKKFEAAQTVLSSEITLHANKLTVQTSNDMMTRSKV